MTARERPPNILLIMGDQLQAASLPAYGHRLVHAPHLTALAAAGVTFESAYCASPLCAPSRAAMLSGRRASSVRVYDNATELASSVPTVTHLLRAAGYATCLVGKMHFVGPDQLHGFEERVTTDVYPADLDWTPDWRVSPAERLPWYHNMSSVFDAGVYEAAMQTDYDDEVAFRAVRKLFDLARQEERPFFLTVSMTNPHDPWEVRRRHWDLYDEATLDLPAVPVVPIEEADPHSRRLRAMSGIDEIPLGEAEHRRARHGYYAAISYLDERVGEVLGALDDAGFGDDTVVVFTADHGELLGEHGLWYKMSFLEGSARVPLIVRAPDLEPRRVATSVSLLDLAPTLLDLAGARHDGAELDGTSLVPALRGTGPGPESVVAEYLAEGVQAPAVMIRRGPLKYVRCPGDPDLLYDLERDPHELENLAATPEHAETVRTLRAESERRWDLEELERRVLRSQADRRLVGRALATGTYTAWDFQPHVDASMQYVRSRADMWELQRRSRLERRAR